MTVISLTVSRTLGAVQTESLWIQSEVDARAGLTAQQLSGLRSPRTETIDRLLEPRGRKSQNIGS